MWGGHEETNGRTDGAAHEIIPFLKYVLPLLIYGGYIGLDHQPPQSGEEKTTMDEGPKKRQDISVGILFNYDF